MLIRKIEHTTVIAHLQIMEGKHPVSAVSNSRHPKLKIVVRKIYCYAGVEGIRIGSNHDLACIVGLRKYSLMQKVVGAGTTGQQRLYEGSIGNERISILNSFFSLKRW